MHERTAMKDDVEEREYIAAENASRSRCVSGVSAAARQIESTVSGFFSNLRRESAIRDFCFPERGTVGLSGFKMADAEEKQRREFVILGNKGRSFRRPEIHAISAVRPALNLRAGKFGNKKQNFLPLPFESGAITVTRRNRTGYTRPYLAHGPHHSTSPLKVHLFHL